MAGPEDFVIQDVVTAPPPRTSEVPSPTAPRDVSAPSLDEVAAAGPELAKQMADLGYHPVVLFGMAAAGKTSLLSSLLALIRTEPALESALVRGDALIDPQSVYGKYLMQNAEQFFGQTVQNFIAGRAPGATKLPLPFFVPVIFRPKGKPEVKIAFMESAGEWYRPQKNTDRYFPALRKEIETFVRSFQLGISFIHLAPYTQTAIRSLSADRSSDPAEIADASLALAGALGAYEEIRANKELDHHLMLVTKWDAHQVHQANLSEILMETGDAVEPFVLQHYSQAYAAFKGLSVPQSQLSLQHYCAGIISGTDHQTLRIDNEHRPAVLSFPKELWAWIYGNALSASGGIREYPFPTVSQKANGPLTSLLAFMDRFFT